MNTINPDLFAKLMTLPDSARHDLLEFLGATPIGEGQLNDLIENIESSIAAMRSPLQNEPSYS
ncbi:hypothetical protein ACFFUT_19010 [Pseudohalocynthiibacter aestuariivivens]|uniref:Uncharacterized protein n=1 Tax=Pseudohalocynthiibacter aestuariivivens TaxID=1591409 RepID=A0ABV5JMF2_9RHOB|nr:hypothetical protein [Pseudohalocynthiibacter aestuariivivens]MBS9715542.1 hypothetical protein [Pseudohalocynthiibacter aestuariivivens]